MGATYFGEVNELDSRAVWYSDEEDDGDCDMVACGDDGYLKAKPVTHEVFRSSIGINFLWVTTKPSSAHARCIISLASATSFKNYKPLTMTHLGNLGSIGKAFVGPDNILWILIDAGNPQIAGQEVGYVVERLMAVIDIELNLSSDCEILILSKQYSTSPNSEYLATDTKNKPAGVPMAAPFLVKSQFESALFENLLLLNRSSVVMCLPNPRDYTFEGSSIIPKEILDLKSSEESLDKTLIFT